MSNNSNPYDFWNWWKNAGSSDWLKIWTTDWKKWVPDPAKIYVAGESDLPIKVNPIFRGAQRQPAVENDLCSVILPFHEPFLSIYNECIRPPLEHGGFRVMKADDIFAPGDYVIQEIWRLINRSRLLVAEVTGKNPNVFYELGIAHTVGKDVVIITQNKDDVPFDIQNLRYFPYSDNEDGRKKLREDVETIVKDIKPIATNPMNWWQM